MKGTRELARILHEKCRGKLLEGEHLRDHTSFRVGGPADLLFFPVDTEDLSEAVKAAGLCGMPLFVMGNGTNLLVRDGGIRGLAIHTGALVGIRGSETVGNQDAERQTVELSVLAGTLLSVVINHTVKLGLSGLEFAAGIPGTVGGAAHMNAGAHGSSFGDIVSWLELVDMKGERVRLARSQVEFFYRGSRWPCEGIVAEVGLRLVHRGDPYVLDRVKHCLSERGKRLPLGVGMAGSVFKNPLGDYAGRIIESLGLKGLRVGQAEVSRRHANVIVNLGGATAGEIEQLVELVARKAKEKAGVRLETEIDIVGEDGR